MGLPPQPPSGQNLLNIIIIPLGLVALVAAVILGIFFYRQWQSRRSFDAFRLAPGSLTARGIDSLRKGYRGRAASFFESALRVKKTPPFEKGIAHALLGRMAETDKRPQDAVREYRKAFDLTGDEDVYSHLADLYLRRNNFHEVTLLTDRLIRARPKAAAAHKIKSVLLYRAGRPAALEKHYAVMRKNRIPSAHTGMLLAMQYLGRDEYDAAAKVLDGIGKDGHPARLYAIRGYMAVKRRYYADAVSYYASALAGGYSSWEAYYNLFLARKGLNEDVKAQDALQKITLGEVPAPLAPTLAEIFYRLGRTADAVRFLDAAIKARPRQAPKLYLLLGDICFRESKLQDAAIAYEEVLSFADGQSYEALLARNNLGVVLGRRGEYLRAWEYFDKVRKLGGKDLALTARINKSVCDFFSKKERSVVLDGLKRLLKDHPHDRRTNLFLGQFSYDDRDYDEALRCFYRVLEADRGNLQAYFFIADIHDRQLKFDKALKEYQGILEGFKKVPGLDAAWINRMAIEIDRERFREAEKILEAYKEKKNVSHEKNLPPLLLANSGLLYFERNEFEQAVNCFRIAASAELPKDDTAERLNELAGDIYLRLGRRAEAEKAYSRAFQSRQSKKILWKLKSLHQAGR